MRALAPEFSSADTAEKVDALLSQLSPLYRHAILRDHPLKEGEDPSKWGLQIANGLSARRIPERHEEADEFLATIDAEEMFDRNLVRIDRIDAMIDRTIKRLVQIKTMKQMYRQLQPRSVTGVTIEGVVDRPDRVKPD